MHCQRTMDILRGCSPLILAGDIHLGIAVAYDNGNITECTSPAAINDVFWRTNFNAVNETHDDGFGNKYRLLGVWNVDQSVSQSTRLPKDTRNESVARKDLRGDGFLVVDLDGESATCETHSYRQSHRTVWSVTVPALATATVNVTT